MNTGGAGRPMQGAGKMGSRGAMKKMMLMGPGANPYDDEMFNMPHPHASITLEKGDLEEFDDDLDFTHTLGRALDLKLLQ